MTRLIYACLLILLPASSAFAQPATSVQNDARELWLVRSQTLTTDLLKDAADLKSTQRAVLWVKLAQRWWHEDPKRAGTWITNAIEVVEQVPNKETPEEREERWDTARILLTIVTPLDQKLAKRLLTALTSDKSTDNDRGAAANALIDAAVTVVEKDPKRAAELGAMAMWAGTPNNNIMELLFPLRAQDPKLADSLFVQALALLKQDPGSRLANSLMYVAFPVQRGLSGNTPVPPEPLRIELLQFYLGLINTKPSNGEGPNSNCGTITWLAPLFSEFERLLPQHMPVVRQAISRCQPGSSLAQQVIDDNTRSQPLNTVESFLKAAADAKATDVRTVYKSRAANLAAEGDDYELAIKILEDMSKEEREFMGEAWDSFRWSWAADGAVEHYKNRRFREMNLLLDGVPSDLQPFAKAGFLVWLPEQSISETAPIIQILNDAITGLRRSNTPESDKHDWYFPLLQLTLKYQPADANAVLKNAISSLNKDKYGKPLNTYEPYRKLGATLLEMDEFVVKDAVTSVTDVQTRAQLRLALLDAALQRLKTTSRN
jgi:hypothetical protein